MIIKLIKFGSILLSRPSGKEAYAAYQPVINNASENENIEINFDGVITFTPSWGDEFITPLHERFGDNLIFKNTENPSVKATL